MTKGDPRAILKAAGVECAEVEVFYRGMEAPRDGRPRPFMHGSLYARLGEADAAILVLARLVAEQAEQLTRLAPKGGPDSVPASGGGCGRGA